jgi:hypothetical protein
MIDPVTGWFEVKEIDSKHAYNIAGMANMLSETKYNYL